MSANNAEAIGKAVLVGGIALVIYSSAPTVILVSSALAIFCVGRMLGKRLR